MYATLTANMATWREPTSRRGWLRRWTWVVSALLVSIPLMLLVLREVFAQSWKAVTGPFDHISIYGVMVYGDSALVLMLVCIGLFELFICRQSNMPVPQFFCSGKWWLMLVPCVLLGQQFLNHFNEPRHGPMVYRQAWVFDIYHDMVAGLVIHQLIAFVALLWLLGRRGVGRRAWMAAILAVLLLGSYVGIWIEQPPKHVIYHGVSVNMSRFGGRWAVDRLYTVERDS